MTRCDVCNLSMQENAIETKGIATGGVEVTITVRQLRLSQQPQDICKTCRNKAIVDLLGFPFRRAGEVPDADGRLQGHSFPGSQ